MIIHTTLNIKYLIFIIMTKFYFKVNRKNFRFCDKLER